LSLGALSAGIRNRRKGFPAVAQARSIRCAGRAQASDKICRLTIPGIKEQPGIMRPIHLFELAAQSNSWLSTRQTLIAGNVANVNTPGYRSLDLKPFEEVLEATKLQMAVTRTGHMAPDPGAMTGSTETENEDSWEVFHSGGNVSIEQEMLKAGEVGRNYSLNTNIVRTFHRMLLTSARPGA
jgi:flagellar basal-body rod protein FlgB